MPSTTAALISRSIHAQAHSKIPRGTREQTFAETAKNNFCTISIFIIYGFEKH
jgi:hypothetical protein